MKLDLHLTPYTKINSKWIKDLNIRTEAIKLLEENIGGMLHDIVLDNYLMDMTSKVQATKAKMDKWDHIKLKSFCSVKEIIRVTSQLMEYEKLLQAKRLIKG